MDILKRVCVWLIGVLIFCLPVITQAASLKSVASINRSLWPEPMITREGFDRASLAENIQFLKALFELQEQSNNYPSLLNVKSPNQRSIAKWSDRTIDVILQNILEARKSCASEKELGCQQINLSRAILKAYVTQFLDDCPPRYQSWADAAHEFYHAYVIEQLRLAALFPETTSEILTFSNQEITGSEWNDLEFLLTFDDGPSAQGGVTDKVTGYLNKAGLNGMFFVLRDPLQNRTDKTSVKEIQALYQNQCVGSHGSVHKPHPRLTNWKESIDSSLNLIQKLIPQNSNRMFFRPPYGQRSEEILSYLTARNCSILLWNIDSQDWNSKIEKDRVADRVLTLMLLWRHGIILFHDVHDRVLVALPKIINETKSAGLHWRDCRKY
jgi:peptidoglycan-N-acetylglucosamine deacetylase